MSNPTKIIPEKSNVSINQVHLEGLALMKMIKHCHEEVSGTADIAQGILLGLLVGDTLEITNCFPFPRNSDDMDMEEDYQLEMMRHQRKVNVDYLSVGWYQSSQLGNFVSRTLLDTQFSYQSSIEESVVIIYDPVKSERGFLSVKAFRLTPEAMNVLNERDFTPEVLRKFKLGHHSLFTEIKVILKNSPLMNVLQCELFEKMPGNEATQFLDLGSLSTMDRQMRSLMESVDELSQEANKFNGFQRQVSKQQQDKHKHILKRQTENAARVARGEKPLPEEDLSKIFKPIPALPRLDATVTAAQIDTYCRELSQFCSQGLGKLYVAKSLQPSDE